MPFHWQTKQLLGLPTTSILQEDTLLPFVLQRQLLQFVLT